MTQHNGSSSNPLVSAYVGEDLETFKRALVKISFAGSGVDKRLDVELEKLRALIKKNVETAAIQSQVECITDLLREIGDDSARLHKKLSGFSSEELIKALMQQSLPGEIRRGLKKLDGDEKNVYVLAAQLAATFLPAPADSQLTAADTAGDNDARPPSLLSRLFAGKSPADPTTAAAGPALETLPAEVIAPLLRLLDQLDLPEQHQASLEALRTQINSLNSVNGLPSLLDELSALVLDASDAEQAQFEAFLAQIHARLAAVEEFLTQNSQRGQETVQDSVTLDQDVRAQVLQMESEASAAADLEQLQSQVRTRLDNIMQRVDRFRVQQVQRVTKGEDEVKRLREQLRATEAEADQLREALREQRARAATDALTQLPNRHAYHDRLQQEYTRWKRYQGKLSLVVCDIDHFKNVNDRYGHACGDAVIKHVGLLLRQGLRESDFIARFGGEEFVLLMPETHLIDATKATNKLRQRLQAMGVTYRAQNIVVTGSFGVAEFEAEDVPRDVFERADRALYRAKTKGRNQVCCERKQGNGES